MLELETFFTFSHAPILFLVSVTLALPRWPAEQDYFFASVLRRAKKTRGGCSFECVSTLASFARFGFVFASLKNSKFCKPAGIPVFPKRVMYTCQLFLRCRREIFILGVLGFLKTTRSFPKIPEEVRSLPKTSEVCRRRSYRENAYPQNQRS